MYSSSGNYEAFARPPKPESTENKRTWIVGSGLSTAAFLVRDAQMPGKKITILEELHLPGSALDGLKFYWLNKRDPNFSLQRATIERGQDAGTGKLFTLNEKAQKEMIKLFLVARKEVEGW
ncbi:hypothetical protein B0T10DRAFT_568388 [Thelonectria olida]|uniref:Uncharacterized protein n=1 Tax=Thelonectria olida TaxID=1576542 RepID=A0A9P9AEW1_9HYPO|nr:hypothetical protein B0T10DRAFT_568388 [Thelonectria olida]